MPARSRFARVRQWLRGWSLLARLSIAAVGIALAAVIFAWSGVFNVGASRGHFAVVELALSFIMHNSVQTHALGAPAPPPLDNPDLEILGASHFHRSCAPCHSAPGQRLNAMAKTMLPPPPELTDASERWKDRELFWIVKHGIKYTGMPAWATQHRDDEVWSLVAFLKVLPMLDAREYARLAFGTDSEPPPLEHTSIAACASCHGDADRAPRSRLVPVLHGQPARFLQSALSAYANGTRHSGIMQPVATDLPENTMAALAQHYSRLAPPPRPPAPASDQGFERGRRLAIEGKPMDGIPPCMACHSGDALETFPRLAGQSAAYMASRLRHLRNGIDDYSGAAIMMPIARAMSDQQIEDASAYFAAQAPERQRP
jgi:cytochrome c553